MKIVLIIIGALIGLGIGANSLKKKAGMTETLQKLPTVGCLVFLIYGALGGFVGWLIYAIF